MNRRLIIGVIVGMLTAQLWAQEKMPLKKPEGATADSFKSLEQKVGYAIAMQQGQSIRKTFGVQGAKLDLEAIVKGFRDGLSGAKSPFSEKDLEDTFRTFQEQVQERNTKQGKEFLAANKKKPGVVTLPSGLQYKVIKKGSGKKPTENEWVEVDYRGTVINGTEFDSSYERGEPYQTPVSGVIPGWVEALQLMEAGSKWEIYVPADLAYGVNGSPNGLIGPNTTLIFEIDLREIIKPKQQGSFGLPPQGKGAEKSEKPAR